MPIRECKAFFQPAEKNTLGGVRGRSPLVKASASADAKACTQWKLYHPVAKVSPGSIGVFHTDIDIRSHCGSKVRCDLGIFFDTCSI